MNEEDIKKILQKNLSEFRFLHCLNVALEAKNIARIYGVNENKAYLVGLAHDVAHEFREEENLDWLKKGKLPQECLKESYRNILHSDIGAIVAKELFNFDEEMCQAIKYHTIGDVKMNTFDKVIFIADKIGRKKLNTQMQKVKELVYQGLLDQALIMYFKILNSSLKNRNLEMHPNSQKLIDLLEKSE